MTRLVEFSLYCLPFLFFILFATYLKSKDLASLAQVLKQIITTYIIVT